MGSRNLARVVTNGRLIGSTMSNKRCISLLLAALPLAAQECIAHNESDSKTKAYLSSGNFFEYWHVICRVKLAK